MNQIERTGPAPSKGSSLARALNERKAAVSRRDRSFLLLDYSGSMEERTDGRHLDSPQPRKIDALREVVHDLRSRNDVRFRTIIFGADVRECDAEIPEPAGGTPLAEAIEMATALGATHIAVASDGIPDSPESAMNAAKRNPGLKIDVFYVGPENSHGKLFLAELAKASGGAFGVSDLGKQAGELTEGLARSLKELPPARTAVAL